MAIYMDYDGIKGDVEESEHTKWIELDTFHWGVGRTVSMATGSGVDRRPGFPAFGEVVITKKNDISSGKLMKEAVLGEGKEVKIHFVRSSSNSSDKYLELELKDVAISSMEQQQKNGDSSRPVEQLTLSYQEFEFTFTGEESDLEESGPNRFGFDLKTAKPK